MASVERLFHILAPRKAFCPCAVFFFGNLTSVFFLRRLRVEHYFDQKVHKSILGQEVLYEDYFFRRVSLILKLRITNVSWRERTNFVTAVKDLCKCICQNRICK